MLLRLWKTAAVAFMVCASLCGNAYAQTIFNQAHTVAAADRAVPVEHTFAISVAGTYQITLTDLGALLTPPAPLAAAKLAITSGGTIVGTPMSAPGSTSFSATQGTYTIHVVGNPGTVPGSGPIGITVADSSNNVIESYSDTLALPPGAIPNNEGVLQGSFAVQTSGSYLVTLSDLQFPQSLGILTLAVTIQGGALVTTLPAAGSNSVTLQSGVTYDIFAVGQASGGPNAGLYGVNVSPAAGGTAVFARTTPVGAVALLASPVLTAGNYTLTVADLAYPSPLSQLGSVVTLNGQAAAQLNAAGSSPFPATANTYQVFALGLPGASGTGSYTLTLQPASGTAAVSLARAVSASGGAVTAYSFDTAQVPTAGTYLLDLADFAFPASFSTISAAAVQNGALLASPLNAVGSQTVTLAAAPVSVLVFAQQGAAGGLFGIELTPKAGGTPAIEATQGVGQLFSGSQISIADAGTYQVAVSDLGFPAPFQSLAVIVTQGSSQVGSIYGGGTFSFAATSGSYFINFVAQPDPTSSDQAGTYAISVASAPAAPTVSLQSSATSVGSGGTVTLVWTSQNATSCVASGSWSGKEPANGSATSPTISATATFTLTCTGAGGSAHKSVTVTLAPPSGGGGGAIEVELLALLFGLTLWRALPVMRPSRTLPTLAPSSNVH